MNAIRFAAGLALVTASIAACAQTSPAMPASSASQPTPIAVTPEAARSANDRAVKRSDVATVVRTGPSAADKVTDTAKNVKDKASKAMAPENAASKPNTSSDGVLAPRRDRN